jgi:dihydroorotase
MYTAHAGIELYAEVFETEGALDRLEGFASRHGPAFYGLPVNTERVVLEKRAWRVPEELAYGAHALVPLRAGGTVDWNLA